MIIQGWKFVPSCVFNSRGSFSFTRYGYKDMKTSQMKYELTIPQHPSSIIGPRKHTALVTLNANRVTPHVIKHTVNHN